MTSANQDARLLSMLADGGDERLLLDGEHRNKYGVCLLPDARDDSIQYSSSTCSPLSDEALSLAKFWMSSNKNAICSEEYSLELQSMRDGLRSIWGLEDSVDIVFGASGTDLELLYPLLSRFDARGRLANIVVLPEEIGSSSLAAAQRRYFSELTPNQRDQSARTGQVYRADVSTTAVDTMEEIEGLLRDEPGPVLLHLVYGSKTGKVFPSVEHVKRWSKERDDLLVVVDACQGRIGSANINEMLGMGWIVMMTGSKFFGGPPFSGIALFPPRFKVVFETECDQGLETLSAFFNRAEFPRKWTLLNAVHDGTNDGLLLRLRIAVFEMFRFSAVRIERVGGLLDQYRQIATDVFGDGELLLHIEGRDPGDDLLLDTIYCVKPGQRFAHRDYSKVSRQLAGEGVLLGQAVPREDVICRIAIGSRNILRYSGMLREQRAAEIRRCMLTIRDRIASALQEC